MNDEFSKFLRLQRKLEMEYQQRDMKTPWTETFEYFLIFVLMMLAGALGVLVFDWILHFGRHV